MTQSITDYTAELAELAAKLDNALPSRLRSIRDAMLGQPSAQRYDTPRTTGHTTVKFCEHHERDNCECGEATTYPAISDPVGEAAVRGASGADKASTDRRNLERAIRAALNSVRSAVAILEGYRPRDPNLTEQTAAENVPGCRSCARLKIRLKDGAEVNRWEPLWRNDLCRWCDDWRRKLGGLPPLDKLADHHAGKRVTLSA